MHTFKTATWFRRLISAGVMVVALTGAAGGQKKDYLTTLEADKVRDEENPGIRIKMFVGYAADRLKKFQYELAHPSADRRRSDRLTSLLNAYAGCLDDASERIHLGVEKQEDIRVGVKEMQEKAKGFLATLEGIAASGPDRDLYKQTLEDALDATKEAIQTSERAAKESAPPPVRRKP